MMRLIAIPLAFAAGVFVSDGLRATARLFSGEAHPRCIENKVCLGAEAPKVFGWVDADRHGLTALLCDDDPNPNANIIFLDGVIAGSRCKGSKFTVELRSPTTRTLLTIDRGRLVEISEGSLHTIDL